jgi:hypothetical protein
MTTVLAALGFTLAGLMLGLWLGERRTRKYLETILYGTRYASQEPEPTQDPPRNQATEDEGILTEVEIAELATQILDEAMASDMEISRQDAMAEAERIVRAMNLESSP